MDWLLKNTRKASSLTIENNSDQNEVKTRKTTYECADTEVNIKISKLPNYWDKMDAHQKLEWVGYHLLFT